MPHRLFRRLTFGAFYLFLSVECNLPMSHRKLSFDLIVQKGFGKREMIEYTPNSISTIEDDKFYFRKVDSRALESVFLENEDESATRT